MMDPLTVDVIVDAEPAEAIERAYHYGVTPTEVSDVDTVVTVLDAPHPVYVPDAWTLVAA